MQNTVHSSLFFICVVPFLIVVYLFPMFTVTRATRVSNAQ